MIVNRTTSILKTLLASICVALFLVAGQKTIAAPGPTYFVVNGSEKTCSTYWTGDEFSHHKLPSGWKIYQETTFYKITTPHGTCALQDEPQDNIYITNLAQNCAKQLNLTYVNKSIIPINQNNVYVHYEASNVYHNHDKTPTYIPAYTEGPFKCHSIKEGINLGLLINNKTKQFTEFIDFGLTMQKGNTSTDTSPKPGDCKILDENWKAYKDVQITSKIITPFGNIDQINPYDKKEVSKSCKAIGLTYVDHVTKNKTSSDVLSTTHILFYALSILAVLAIGLFGIMKYRAKKNQST